MWENRVSLFFALAKKAGIAAPAVPTALRETKMAAMPVFVEFPTTLHSQAVLGRSNEQTTASVSSLSHAKDFSAVLPRQKRIDDVNRLKVAP